MKILNFKELLNTDIDINRIVCINQVWTKGHSSWSYLDLPRTNDGLIYIENGSAVYTMADKAEITARCKDILYIPKNSRYSVKFVPAESRSILLNFNITYNADEKIETGDAAVVGHDNSGVIRKNFDELCRLYSNTTNTLMIKAKLMELICMLADTENRDETDAAIVYINSHLNMSKSVSDIARMFAMSESTFRRKITEKTGLSPSRYIAKQKTEKAKQLLEISELSVDDISGMLGFYDCAHFVKTFKKETGKTPMRYRNLKE